MGPIATADKPDVTSSVAGDERRFCCRCDEIISDDPCEDHVDPELQQPTHPGCCAVCWSERAAEYGIQIGLGP